MFNGSNETSFTKKSFKLFREGKLQEALELYDEILKIEPNNAEAWHGKGGVLVALGNNRAALEAYDKS
ncbi:tetratricopeptide repeat protein, partial [Methanobacterium formicicum]